MALKKSELYSAIWQSCDELRGGMDASQYKDYVLVLLFMKYVSDKAKISDEGLYVPQGASFYDMVEAKGQPDIGDRINKIIAKLAEENELRGIIDQADFNDPSKMGDNNKERAERLSNLISIFENPQLDFSRNRAEDDDLLGDAYEYLMRHFATESGKSKGQFYTPSEVSRVLAKIVGAHEATKSSQSIYDPACGSGSLLLKAASEAPVSLSLYGQEKDIATAGLARMNMILHDYDTAEIWQGNTLTSPHWKEPTGQLKTFDFVVANPPFSDKAWTNGMSPENDEFWRFNGFGIPPQKNGDFAYLLHMLKSLKSKGKAAVILPHGVLFRSNAEYEIRKNLVQRGYIRAIIGLPANLFFGTGIPACIILLDKENAENRTGVFMIDASKGYLKDGNKNRLREQDIHKIVDVFRKVQDVPRYSRMVSLAEIEQNEYNLNLPRYIDIKEEEDLQDLAGHLQGGIPQADIDRLADYWAVCPALRNSLFEPERPGYWRVAALDIRAAISEHKEFQEWEACVDKTYSNWATLVQKTLYAIDSNTRPKKRIDEISEGLLENAFAKIPLLDPYNIYQLLMNYWNEQMQDDMYLIVQEGWEVGREFEPLKGKASLAKLKGRIIPTELVIDRYLKEERRALDTVREQLEMLEQQLQELEEEHTGEEGLLSDYMDEKGKLQIRSLKTRLKEIEEEADAEEEQQVLELYLRLTKEQEDQKKEVIELGIKLQEALIAQYAQLTVPEIRQLVVDDKWLAHLKREVRGATQRIAQHLAGRVQLLADRYAVPLPLLEQQVEELEMKVKKHLVSMNLKV